MALTPNERVLRSRLASHASWGKTLDRTARTEPARRKFDERFLAQADGDPVRAESLRKEYYIGLAFKSATARRRRGEARKQAIMSRDVMQSNDPVQD
jgi:hypothetical protein